MNVHLDHDEITALLQTEAFSPPRWRIVCFWSGLLMLLLIGLHLLFTLQHQPASSPAQTSLSLMEWRNGHPYPLQNPKLQACLLRWGKQQKLPPPQQLLLSRQPERWSLVWIGAADSLNFSRAGQPQGLCR